jgi:hypothetical protein
MEGHMRMAHATIGRLSVIVALTLAFTLAVPLPTPRAEVGTQRTTYAMTDCIHLRTTPRRILFACGDGTFYVDHLRWFRWRTWRAFGGGLFHMNDCRPSCAEGRFHTAWGHIWLRNRERCEPSGRFVFQHVRIRYVGALLGRRRAAFGNVGCPLPL